MGDPLKKVRPGQALDIPAATHNAMIDAARAHKAQAQGARGLPPPPRASGILPVQNASGADRERFDILSIQIMVYSSTDNLDEFKGNPAIVGSMPGTAQMGRFVILLEPIPSGRIGRGLVMGVTPVKVNFAGENDTYADLEDGQAGRLASHSSAGSARILWKEEGTGEKWALVKVGAVSAGGSGSAIEFGVVSGDFDTGEVMTIEASDVLGELIGGGELSIHVCSALRRTTSEPYETDEVVAWLRYASPVDDGYNSDVVGILLGIHQGTESSPTSIAGHNAEASADTETWDRASQGEDNGVRVEVYRVHLEDNEDGTAQLQLFGRDKLYDSAGHLRSIGAESVLQDFTLQIGGGCF